MIDRPHWSYSQLNQYLRCPLQYFFERVAKLPKPFVSSSLVLGSAVHQGLAEYHRLLQVGRPATSDRLHEVYRQAWETAEADRPIQYRDGEDRTKLVDQGIALLELYRQQPSPQNILAVEQPMLVPLHNSQGEFLEKPLMAVLDLLSREASGLTVTEFKTSGRRFADSEADTAVQASCYVHAVKEKYDEPATVRYTVLVKTKTPTVQQLVTVRTNDDLGRLGDLVEAVERAIEAEAFYPIESPQTCAGCPFFKPCREWRGSRRGCAADQQNRGHHADRDVGQGWANLPTGNGRETSLPIDRATNERRRSDR